VKSGPNQFFYRRHLEKNHPWIKKIDDCVGENNEYIEALYKNKLENLYDDQGKV
jgi:hypothetical protein